MLWSAGLGVFKTSFPGVWRSNLFSWCRLPFSASVICSADMNGVDVSCGNELCINMLFLCPCGLGRGFIKNVPNKAEHFLLLFFLNVSPKLHLLKNAVRNKLGRIPKLRQHSESRSCHLCKSACANASVARWTSCLPLNTLNLLSPRKDDWQTNCSYSDFSIC